MIQLFFQDDSVVLTWFTLYCVELHFWLVSRGCRIVHTDGIDDMWRLNIGRFSTLSPLWRWNITSLCSPLRSWTKIIDFIQLVLSKVGPTYSNYGDYTRFWQFSKACDILIFWRQDISSEVWMTNWMCSAYDWTSSQHEIYMLCRHLEVFTPVPGSSLSWLNYYCTDLKVR